MNTQQEKYYFESVYKVICIKLTSVGIATAKKYYLTIGLVWSRGKEQSIHLHNPKLEHCGSSFCPNANATSTVPHTDYFDLVPVTGNGILIESGWTTQ